MEKEIVSECDHKETCWKFKNCHKTGCFYVLNKAFRVKYLNLRSNSILFLKGTILQLDPSVLATGFFGHILFA